MTDRERQLHVLEMIANSATVNKILLPEELADLRSLLEDLKRRNEATEKIILNESRLVQLEIDLRNQIEMLKEGLKNCIPVLEWAEKKARGVYGNETAVSKSYKEGIKEITTALSVDEKPMTHHETGERIP